MRYLLAALPLAALLLPVSGAEAQVPGSYQRSCTGINQNGSILIARCRSPNGQMNETTIDTDQCGRSDIGNAYGRLVCGNVKGTSRPVAGGGGYGQQGGYGQPGGGYGQGGRPYRGGDDGPAYGQPGYGAPPPRYQQPYSPDGYAPRPPRPRYDPDQDD